MYLHKHGLMLFLFLWTNQSVHNIKSTNEVKKGKENGMSIQKSNVLGLYGLEP